MLAICNHQQHPPANLLVLCVFLTFVINKHTYYQQYPVRTLLYLRTSSPFASLMSKFLAGIRGKKFRRNPKFQSYINRWNPDFRQDFLALIGNLIVEMQINPHFTFKSDREFDRESWEIRRKKSVGIPKFQSQINRNKLTGIRPKIWTSTLQMVIWRSVLRIFFLAWHASGCV